MCDIGYEASMEGKCTVNCGDKIIIAPEECDDGNMIPYDGCHECKISCP